jgi:short-subunit dehydrogenase
MKDKYAFVLKSIKKDLSLLSKQPDLTGKTYIVSGASRGIGLNIAKKLVQHGGNVTIIGKTPFKLRSLATILSYLFKLKTVVIILYI